MPLAQGSTTIRRRPKDGNDGQDAVRYWLVPSASVIKKSQSGAFSPAKITCTKYKQSGNNAPIETSEGTIKYQTVNVAGTTSGSSDYPSGGVSPTASITAIIFTMYVNNVAVASETIPILDNGADATSYWLILNTLVVQRSGTTMTPSTITCKAMMKKGDEAAKEATGLTIKYTRTTTNGTTSWSNYSSAVTFNSSTQSILFQLLDANNNELASETVIAVNDGAPGSPGSPGIQGCIIRQTEWDPNGVEYHNDTSLTTTPRFLDVVIIKRSDGDILANGVRFSAYMCVKTHTSSTQDAVNPIKNEQYPNYWQKFDYYVPIYTPLIWAEYAYLQIAQTNQILISNDDKVSGGFGGGNPALWLGAEEFDSAPFRVNRYGEAWMLNAHIEGDIKAGNPDGQHIHIDPETKSMVIYDANKEAVAFFEGNSHTSLSTLTGGSSGTFTMNDTNKNGAKSVSGNNTATQRLTGTLRISSYIQSNAAVEVVVSGSMYAFATPADTVSSGSSSGTTRPSIPDIQIQEPQMMAGGSATLILYLTTYTTSALTTVKSRTVVHSLSGLSSGSKYTLSNKRAKTSGGGYHVLEMYYDVSASGSGKSASVSWGTNVASGVTFSASYVSDFYVSRFFANGFCLAKSAQNYIWAYNQGTNGMRFVMENNGNGIDVSNSGIKIKHHSGNWINLPKFVYHALWECSGTTYTQKNQISWDGYYPTLSRVSEGRVRLTFPATWISAFSLNLSNFRIMTQGLMTTSGYPIKVSLQTFSTAGSITFDLSDDDSQNDGSFLIDIDYIGN